jgi:hypothetical protein
MDRRLEKVVTLLREMMGAGAVGGPTNRIAGGQIAGTKEAGDDPPVKKKKKYIYQGPGSRSRWMK